MGSFRVAVAGIALTFGLGLLLQQGVSGQEKGAKAFNLVLKSVTVKETNKDDKSWDINDGKPDLFVRIKNLSDTGQKSFVSETRDDAFTATYNRIAMTVLDGTRLEIEVLDKDVASDDMIGKVTMQISADMLKKGSHELTFDQVRSVVLEFQTPDAPK